MKPLGRSRVRPLLRASDGELGAAACPERLPLSRGGKKRGRSAANPPRAILLVLVDRERLGHVFASPSGSRPALYTFDRSWPSRMPLCDSDGAKAGRRGFVGQARDAAAEACASSRRQRGQVRVFRRNRASRGRPIGPCTLAVFCSGGLRPPLSALNRAPLCDSYRARTGHCYFVGQARGGGR